MLKRTRKPYPSILLGLLLAVFISPPIWADDMEIYVTPGTESVNPNVLFILDESGSMSNYDGQPTNRMDQLKEAMTTILSDPDLDGVNVAIQGFTTWYANKTFTRVVCTTETQCSYPCDPTCVDTTECRGDCDSNNQCPEDWKNSHDCQYEDVCVGDCDSNNQCPDDWKNAHDCYEETQTITRCVGDCYNGDQCPDWWKEKHKCKYKKKKVCKGDCYYDSDNDRYTCPSWWRRQGHDCWYEREKVCVGDCDPNNQCPSGWKKKHDCDYEEITVTQCIGDCDSNDQCPDDWKNAHDCGYETACTGDCYNGDQCPDWWRESHYCWYYTDTNCTYSCDQVCQDVDVCHTETTTITNLTPIGSKNYVNMIHSDFVSVSDTSRQALLDVVDTLKPIGWTPTVYALKDAVAWFEDSVTDASNRTYQSPISLWCQPNHIVLLSDGRPNTNDQTSYRGQTCARDSESRWSDGRCAREISGWAYNADLRTTPDDGTDSGGHDWQGTQNIVTHTIGFHTTSGPELFLNSVAREGGGSFYTANSAQDLVDVFSAILAEAGATVNYSYTTPTIPMDASNAVVSADKIYVPIFQPQVSEYWNGNLKKYTIVLDADNNVVLQGAGGVPVLDSDYQFLDTAQDLWSPIVDGADPLKGGAASQLTGTRNLYTYHSTSSSRDLTAADNRLIASNNEITAAMLGVSDNTTRTDLLNWVSTGREEMGGPLHTKPLVATYENEEQLVLLPTSEGVVHAFDAETGHELWGYMPVELLPNLQRIREDKSWTGPPIYGIDGPAVLFHRDDGAGTISNANNGRIDTGEKAYYIFGMRRGGNNYYALDISDRTAPKLLWEIKGGTGDFARLGQTWSAPQIGRIKVNGIETDVLIFGGGYDLQQDDVTGARTADTLGNAIYIVNVDTGQRLKWISNTGADLNISGMTNAIPASVTVIDVNADGISDRIYAADVGGRILRIDLEDTLTGGVIADLNGGTSAEDNRRFFNAPVVAYVSIGGNRYLAIVIGSGFIPEPADSTVQDRFYMIKDYAVFGPPEDDHGNIVYTTLTESDLYDATGNEIQVADDAPPALIEQAERARAELNAKQGWYIDMDPKEKVFSKAGVYDYVVLFSTYTVTNATTPSDICKVGSIDGYGSIYAVSLLDATALFATMDGNADALDVNDRARTLNVPGLPPEPVVIYPGTANGGNNGDSNNGGADSGNNGTGSTPSGVVVAIGGLEKIVTWPDRFRALYWEEVLPQ